MTTEFDRPDVFISHAHEDKEVARPLAEALRQRGLTVWYDEYVLRLGDSLREVIEHGLATTSFGIVILSPSFFAKEWPKRELDALLARETTNRSKVLLPLWHNLTLEEITAHTPILAGRLAISTAKGIPFIVERILEVIEAERPRSAPAVAPLAVSISKAELPRTEQLTTENNVDKTRQKELLIRPSRLAIAALTATVLVGGVLLWRPWSFSLARSGPQLPPQSVETHRSNPANRASAKVAVNSAGMAIKAPLLPTATPRRSAVPAKMACVPGEEKRSRDGIDFVHICAGTFIMGSAENDPQAESNEKPAHQVSLSEFWIGKTEITQEQYSHFRTDNPNLGRNLPVTSVTWSEAQEACKHFDGRLPTEAEWEFAARAGSQSIWSFGDDERKLGDYAWYAENSAGHPQHVTTKKANAWGLYDMYGNAREWVADWYGPYTSAAQTDPSGPTTGETHVVRGGAFFSPARSLRSAFRGIGPTFENAGGLGFRCVNGPT